MSYLTCRQDFPFLKAHHHESWLNGASTGKVVPGMRIWQANGGSLAFVWPSHGSAEDENKAYYEAISGEAAEFKICTCRYSTK